MRLVPGEGFAADNCSAQAGNLSLCMWSSYWRAYVSKWELENSLQLLDALNGVCREVLPTVREYDDDYSAHRIQTVYV